MRLSPIFIFCAAGLTTFAVSQTLTPTVHAQGTNAQNSLRVSVQNLHSTQTVCGRELTGRLENTGQQTLTYTSVVCVFTDASGKEVGRSDAYLTAGPVGPGQSASFRALSPSVPASAKVSLQLREAGQTVTVEMSPVQAASRRTTSR